MTEGDIDVVKVAGEHMLRTAVGLYRITKVLEEKCELEWGEDLVRWTGAATAQPMLLCFGIELGLKALHRLGGQGVPEKKHDCLELYRALKVETKENLERALGLGPLEPVNEKLTESGLWVVETVEGLLEGNKNMFVDWRYREEKPGWKAFNVSEAQRIMEAIESVGKVMVEERCWD